MVARGARGEAPSAVLAVVESALRSAVERAGVEEVVSVVEAVVESMLTVVTKELRMDTAVGMELGGASGQGAEAADVSPYATRLFKAADGSYAVKIASAACGAAVEAEEGQQLAGGDGEGGEGGEGGEDDEEDGVMVMALEEADDEEVEEEEAPVLVTDEEAVEAQKAEVKTDVSGAAAIIKPGAGLAGSPSSVLAPPDSFGGSPLLLAAAGAAEASVDFELAAAHCEVAGDCGDGQEIVQMVNREVAASLELAAALDEWEIVEIEQGLPPLRA